MRNILILCGVTLLAIGAFAAWKLTQTKHYGEPFKGAPRAELKELIEQPEHFKGMPVSIAGTVLRQCPVSGCWFYFKTADGRDLRVELGDTVPGLPQKIGHEAVVEGRIVPQGPTYIFVGTGVEFGKNAAPKPPDETLAQAERASKPMDDGYPVDFCIVGGEKLGSMGDPVEYQHEGRTVKFCCKGCVSSFKKDPAHFIGELDRAAKAGAPATPKAH
ncbi:MAG: hypothetical protein KIS92_24805 [Planctomycetota bacterium]|nr:hypothetical protein [Planctomycetota bacterium]